MFFRLKLVDLFGIALGLFATLSQIVLMRESLSLSGGNELTVGLGFAAWLMGVGAGALLAGALKKPLGSLVICGISAPFIVGACLFTLRFHRGILDLPPGGDPSLVAMICLLSFGLGAGGLTVGFLFTAAARAASSSEKTPVSRLYTAEAVGSLLGGLLFTFLLSGRISHLMTVGTAGFIILAGLALSRRGLIISIVSGAIAASLIAVSAAGLLTRLDRWAEVRAFEQTQAATEFVATVDSAYGRLTLGKSEDQFVLLTDGRIDHAFPEPWERTVPVHMALVQHPNPKSILVIGGGPSDLLPAVLAHSPERVVLTYLDNGVGDLCRPYWSEATLKALADPRVTVVNDDGRRYVINTSDRFDVIMISSRPPLSGQANRYHTYEFFSAAKEIMNPSGTLTVLAPGGANVLAPEAARATASELATIKAVFYDVVIVPGIRTTLHAAIKKGVVSADPDVLRKRYEDRGVESPYFSSRRFADLLDTSRVEEILNQLTRWPAVINRDTKPVVYLAALQLWERSLTKSRSANDGTFTGFAERFAWLFLVLPLLGWFIWQWLYVSKGRSNGASVSVFAIGTTGAAGMAGEIVVLYTFQAASGQLYTGLALLIALFMAGLALGAFWGRRKLSSGGLTQSIIADGLVLAFLLLSGPVLSASLSFPELVTAWSLVAGVVTGTAFPALLGRAARHRSGDERRVAAAIESADHVGAAFGALVTGVVWLPVYGISVTFLLFACFKATSTAALIITRKTG